MTTGEQIRLALNISEMSADNQRTFFKTLKGVLTDAEIQAFQIVVAYLGMMNDPNKTNAIKTAMAAKLYEEFNK